MPTIYIKLRLILLFGVCLMPEFLFSQNNNADSFKMVSVPDTLKTTFDRANYLVAHYWDFFDFSDTTCIHHPEVTDQAFSNYLSILPYASKKVEEKANMQLLTNAKKQPKVFDYFTMLFEKYLYEPNSPLFNEEFYIPVLQYLLTLPDLEYARRQNCEFRLKMSLKNRVGTKAANFDYLDAEGKKQTLWGMPNDRDILLIFFDPDCDHCVETLAKLRTEPHMMIKSMQGKLSVLAIYAEGKKDKWEECKRVLPVDWSVGLDLSDIRKHILYDLKAMPTIYLLDNNKNVVLKDARVEQIVQALK